MNRSVAREALKINAKVLATFAPRSINASLFNLLRQSVEKVTSYMTQKQILILAFIESNKKPVREKHFKQLKTVQRVTGYVNFRNENQLMLD